MGRVAGDSGRTHLWRGEQLRRAAHAGRDRAAAGTHLFDFAGDLYGKPVEVIPVRWLREERRFDSLEALREQIAKDCLEARSTLLDT